MGSTGHGKFGDYSEQRNYNMGNGTTQGMYTSTNAGVWGKEGCPITLSTIRLEDVQTSQYYLERQELPEIGDDVYLSDQIHNGRLVVVHTASNLIIGNLPTSHNYMIKCLERNYTGNVVAAGMQPIPFIVVDLHV